MRSRHRTAFTLLEMIAVLTLLALVAAAISIAVRGPVHRARFRACLTGIRSLDEAARRRCLATQTQATVVIDLKDGTIAETRVFDSQPLVRSYRLPDSVQLETLLVSGTVPVGDRHELVFGPTGGSATYALKLNGASESVWLVFFGGAGQCEEEHDDKKVWKLFERLYEEGVDAS